MRYIASAFLIAIEFTLRMPRFPGVASRASTQKALGKPACRKIALAV